MKEEKRKLEEDRCGICREESKGEKKREKRKDENTQEKRNSRRIGER